METHELTKLTSDVFGNVSEKISFYLDLKKGVLENQYVETLSDTFKLASLVKNTTSIIMQKRFESFLKGFVPENEITEKQMKKLSEYINDEAKAEFIADTFSKIMLAQSSKACFVMGTMLQTMVNNKSDLTHNELICIHALSNFFDIDIINFSFIHDYIQQKGNRKYANLDTRQFKIEIEHKSLNMASVYLTIEKAVTYQLLRTYNEVELDIDEDNPSFSSSAEVEEETKVTEPGLLLYQFIHRSGIAS